MCMVSIETAWPPSCCTSEQGRLGLGIWTFEDGHGRVAVGGATAGGASRRLHLQSEVDPLHSAHIHTGRRHIRWDTETLGCIPSLSSIPALEQRLLVDSLAEIKAWMDAVSGLTWA